MQLHEITPANVETFAKQFVEAVPDDMRGSFQCDLKECSITLWTRSKNEALCTITVKDILQRFGFHLVSMTCEPHQDCVTLIMTFTDNHEQLILASEVITPIMFE